MMRLISLAMLLNLVALAVPLRAAAASTPASAPAEASAGSYHLRPDDVIDITVLGLPQLDKTVTLLPDGSFTYPRLGTIMAGGLTPQELQQLLYKGLDRFYNNLDVTVSVKSLRSDHVTVSGAVKNSGIYEMHPGWTVRELLAAAGGLATLNGPPEPDQMRATLIRKSGERIVLNLGQLLSEPGAADLPALEPDDELMVEDLTIQVQVEGQVTNPGPYPLPPGATPLDALQAAKGPTDKAALSRAYIRRGSQTIPVNLLPFMSGKVVNTSLPTLQRFDTLYVPENKNRFLVMGGVQRPGPYSIPEDEPLHLMGAIALAGGPVPHAKIKDVTLLEQVNGKDQSTTVNLQEIVKGDLRHDVLIRPGDMIYVPDPSKTGPLDVLPSLLQAALLFGL